jgi:alkylation response protein AidB-like acyl-CoA dehydrogenase
MLTFSPTEEQEEIRQLALNIASEQLRQAARRAEKDGDISPSLMQTIAQTGLTTPFSETYGGSGHIEAVTHVLIAEELGFGDAGLAMNILGSMLAPLTVTLAGDESQQRRYVPVFSDQQQGHKQRGGFAFAERTGGYMLEDIQVTLRREGDGYVLNGTKRDVLHGGQATLRVVLCRMEGTTGLDGLCAIVLPDGVEGVQVSEDVQKLGLLAAPSASYTFENVVVPASAMLGTPGCEGVVCAASLAMLLRAGVACGMTRASLEYARDYAKDRIAFGRPIASYQSIAFIIAEMAMKLDGVRLLLWNAAIEWDRGNDRHALVRMVREVEAAQYQAVKLVKTATIDAIQVLGGAGYLQDHPVEMWARNAAAMD